MGLPLFRGFRSRLSGRSGASIKAEHGPADTLADMKISDEQIRLAVEYLREAGAHGDAACEAPDGDLSDLVRRVVEEVERLPDVREERVAEARSLIDGHLPDAEEVAETLIKRLVADQVR